MTFYIKPPRGSVSLEKLYTYTQKRFEFLLQVSHCHGDVVMMKDVVEESAVVANSDCLLEGSHKDIISHFMLRIVFAQSDEMKKFFIDAEMQLFSFRMSCMTEPELMSSLKTIRRLHRTLLTSKQIKSPELQNIQKFLDALVVHLSWDDLVKYYLNGSQDKFVVLPFHHVPKLVGRRLVALHRGYAYIPCCKLLDVLSFVFHKLVHMGMIKATSVLTDILGGEDRRISCLCRRLKAVFSTMYNPGHVMSNMMNGPVTAEDVDELSHSFPLCMAHLVKELRRKHRLRHHSRVMLTLFLKEVGLPLHEALQFWRKEYSKPGCHDNGCNHNWSKDARRYTYSIRHLYGLEGSRTNYRAHSCASVQKLTLGPGEEGGCPFSDFDRNNLSKVLTDSGLAPHTVTSVVDLSAQHCHYRACATYLKAKVANRHGGGLVSKINLHIDGSCAKLKLKSDFCLDCSRDVEVSSDVMIERNNICELSFTHSANMHMVETECAQKTLKRECKIITNSEGTPFRKKVRPNTESDMDSGVHMSEELKSDIKHTPLSQSNLTNENTNNRSSSHSQRHTLQPSTDGTCIADFSSHHITANERSIQLNIRKPIDFVVSYNKLLKGLGHEEK